jgi:serine/threonine-protein kinase
MLHPELSVRESLRKRFLREGHAANSVKHPGVVAVVDEDVADDGAAFLVMELLDGTNLEAFAQQSGGRLPVPLACSVLEQLLDVIAAAHASGIVHRDLKPSNLFVAPDGTLRVLDFGIARVRDGLANEKDRTATGVLLGTPAYMAPEQARAKSSDIDARTDLWAAAATFFTLVSGQTVHKGETSAEIMIAAATSFPRSVRTVASVPEAIARVIDRALSFDRASRFASAVEMREELRLACVEAFGALPSRSHLVADVPAISSARTLAADPSSLEKTVPAVSTNAPATLVMRPARSRVLLQLGAIAAICGTAVVVVMLTRDPTPRTEATTVVDSAKTASATMTTTASAPPVVASSAPVLEAPTSPPPPKTAAHATSHAPNCSPPYYFDHGMRIFKKECL